MLIKSRVNISLASLALLIVVSIVFTYYVLNNYTATVGDLTNTRISREELLIEGQLLISNIHADVLGETILNINEPHIASRNLDHNAINFYRSIKNIKDDGLTDDIIIHDLNRSFQTYFIFSKRLLSNSINTRPSIDSIRHYNKMYNELIDKMKKFFSESDRILTLKINSINETINSLFILFIVISLFASVFLLWVSVGLIRSVVNPLNLLTESIKDYEGGKPFKTFGHYPANELGSIGEAFDHVATAIQENELRARLLFENALVGLCSFSPEGKIYAMNTEFAKILGRDNFLHGVDITDVSIKNIMDSTEWQNAISLALESSEAVVREISFININSEKIRLLISLKRVSSAGAPYIECSALNITSRHEAEEKLRMLSKKLVNIEEEERRSIALELHDNLAQDLAALNISLTTICNDEHSIKSQLSKRLYSCQSIVRDLLVKIRMIMHDLKPYNLEFSSLDAIVENAINDIKINSPVNIDYTSTGTEDLNLGLEYKIHLFRIMQEAVKNAIKHSKCDQILISLKVMNKELRMSVVDSGLGFNVDKRRISALLHNRRGLQGMYDRADILNAKLLIMSTEGSGTTIALKVPLNNLADGSK